MVEISVNGEDNIHMLQLLLFLSLENEGVYRSSGERGGGPAI